MKAIALLLISAASIIAQEAPHEFRTVNGVTVDITPAIQWRNHTTGGLTNRPLPHWKAIKVASIGERVSSWYRCSVVNEQGSQAEIYLANVPADVSTPLLRLSQVKARLEELSGTRPTGIQGDRTGRTAAAAAASYVQEKRSLEKEERELTPKALAAQGKEVFAMFTGRKYRDLDIWDCGVRRASSAR